MSWLTDIASDATLPERRAGAEILAEKRCLELSGIRFFAGFESQLETSVRDQDLLSPSGVSENPSLTRRVAKRVAQKRGHQ
jgi:hypothetical protein